MNKEDYKALRNSNTSDYDLLYKYFLESGGKRVAAPEFIMKFNQWIGGRNTIVKEIINRLDNKHQYVGNK